MSLCINCKVQIQLNPDNSTSDNSNSWKTRIKSNFPWISPHFSVIFTRLFWTRITQILCLLELNFLSLHQKFTKIYHDNSISGSCNSTRMPPHYSFLPYKGTRKSTKTNTGEHYSNLILIVATNRSRFIVRKCLIMLTFLMKFLKLNLHYTIHRSTEKSVTINS